MPSRPGDAFEFVRARGLFLYAQGRDQQWIELHTILFVTAEEYGYFLLQNESGIEKRSGNEKHGDSGGQHALVNLFQLSPAPIF